MKYRLEDKDAMTFIGHGYVCGGAGDLKEKIKDTTQHWLGSRREQEHLKGIRPEENVWYDIYTDFTDEGFTHYIGVKKPENLEGFISADRQCQAADVACDHGAGMSGEHDIDSEYCTFREIHVPAGKYIIVESERKESPEEDYLELQRQIISQWMPTSGYMLSERPQINRVVMDPEPEKRYMEIWMPIE